MENLNNLNLAKKSINLKIILKINNINSFLYKQFVGM